MAEAANKSDDCKDQLVKPGAANKSDTCDDKLVKPGASFEEVLQAYTRRFFLATPEPTMWERLRETQELMGMEEYTNNGSGEEQPLDNEGGQDSKDAD